MILRKRRKTASLQGNFNKTRKWIKVLITTCILLIVSNVFHTLTLCYAKLVIERHITSLDMVCSEGNVGDW